MNSPGHFLDSARLSIANQVSRSLGILLEAALDGVDFGKKGCDLTIAVPRFRLKEKPTALVQKLVSEVSISNFLGVFFVDNKICSFNRMTMLSPSLETVSLSTIVVARQIWFDHR